MTADEQAAAMIPVACEMACLVRDWDQAAIAARLDAVLMQEPQDDGLQRLYALIVVLAAMVPDDAPLPELLGWLEPGSPQREEMLARAHTRAALRQQRGLVLWGPMAALEREYQQGRTARRKAKAAEESEAA